MTQFPAKVPIPVGSGDSAEFWSWLRSGELRLQRCDACKVVRHPPQPTCASCGSTERTWVRASGRGEVWSSTTIFPPVLPEFADAAPYQALVVHLEEGVFMVTQPAPGLELTIGEAVEVVVHVVNDDVALPLVRRSPTAAS